MRESVVTIGKESPLVGVYTKPKASNLKHSKVAVILLNSGVIHRVGSCRLSVNLARAITQESGLQTLRFDFSGIGDSEPRRSTLTASESAVQEVQEVMNHLVRERGIEKFILYGLCSGAYASYHTAVKDPRVIGFAQIDGYCYLSPKSYLHHYLPRLLSVKRWINLLKRVLGVSTQKSGSEVSGIEKRFFEVPKFPDFPPKAEVEQGLTNLAARGLKLFSVFCHSESYNYENQFNDCFRAAKFGDQHTLLYLKDASHILAEPEDQQLVIRELSHWAGQTASGE